MKKLACRRYLNQATTQAQLLRYANHLLKVHADDVSREVALCELASSSSFNRRAYQEVETLAQRVEENYAKR